MENRQFITQGDGLPQWENPISHAVVVNNMCFISGQLSVNEAGEFVSGTIDEGAAWAFDKFFAAATAAGFDRSDIVYIDIAFANLSQVQAVNNLYMQLFPEGRRPARTIYEAAALPFGGKIKVVATAVKSLPIYNIACLFLYNVALTAAKEVKLPLHKQVSCNQKLTTIWWLIKFCKTKCKVARAVLFQVH